MAKKHKHKPQALTDSLTSEHPNSEPDEGNEETPQPKRKWSYNLKKLLADDIDESFADLTSKNSFISENEKEEAIAEMADINTDFLFDDFMVGEKNNGPQKSYSKLVRPEQEFFIPEIPRKVAKELFDEAMDQAESRAEQVEVEESYLTNGTEIRIETVRQIIEASLYVLGSEGMNIWDLKRVTNLPLVVVRVILDEMMELKDKDPNSGLTIRKYGNRYKMLTKKELYPSISQMLNKKERKPLSESTMEILSIIAYNQPCTRGIIERIRDRDPSNAINRLLELELIEKAGRSTSAGKPWLYTVTQKFFDLFGIKSLNDLPRVDRQQRYEEEVDIFARDGVADDSDSEDQNH